MNKVVLKEDLSKVAISGDYRDLNNKPPDTLVPTKVSEFENDSNFIDNTDLGNIHDLTMDLQNKITADNKALNCVDAINVVFQCGNNVKQDTVTTLLAKGATGVTVDSSWPVILQALRDLVIAGTSGAPGTLHQITKLNIPLGGIKTITLDHIVQNFQLATSVLIFIPGNTGVVEHECSFDNSDSTKFNYDSTAIIFDGKMHPINQSIINWVGLENIENYNTYSCEIDESPYKSIDNLVDNGSSLSIGIVPLDQLITVKSDISLMGIDRIKSVSESSQGFRFALSFDSGVTYSIWDRTSWITVDIANTNDVKSKFMTKATLDTLTDTQLEILRNGSTTLRVAYLAEQTLSKDLCYTDQLDITVDMKGTDNIAPQANWSYRLLDDKQTIEYTFYASGTYTINYI